MQQEENQAPGDDRDSFPLVAVIDDEELLRDVVGELLDEHGYRVGLFGSAEEALGWQELAEADCILTDIKMPGMGGEAFLQEMVQRSGDAPVVMITAHGDVRTAVRCLKAGAYDFLEKPFDEEVLLSTVSRAVERSVLRREHRRLKNRVEQVEAGENGRFGLVGVSPAMQALYQQIQVVAGSEAPVLLHGETGSGKELVARAIHDLSRRSRGPFVAVNAGALPESLLESELFGHAKGAFTGAVSKRAGKLVASSGGTLLLDEIESLSLKAQVQLLRVLEDGQVASLGDDRPRTVDIRLLTTTKVPLTELVTESTMREDFFHRIVVLSVMVPPLRDRLEDLPLLVGHFVRRAAARAKMDPPAVPDSVLREMNAYQWPGNVRELQNAVERMVVTAQDGKAGHFSPAIGGRAPATSDRLLSLPATQGPLREALERTEREVIAATLRSQGGQVSAAARSLGISRRALYQRLKRYGIRGDDPR